MEPAETTPSPVSRRGVLTWLTGLLGVVAAAIVAIPFVGYLFARRRSPAADSWVPLGPVSDFPVDETRLITFDTPLAVEWDDMVALTGVYVRNRGEAAGDEDQFMVLTMNCAHLGCPVSWFPQSGLFMCPCHGGVYYEDGERASGPPPRGLFHCVWRVDDGTLEVRPPHFPTLQDTPSQPA